MDTRWRRKLPIQADDFLERRSGKFPQWTDPLAASTKQLHTIDLDEHIPSAVAEGLRHRGVRILTVNETGMLGAPDKKHLKFAREEECVIVSHDDDFLRLVAEGYSHSGLVYVPRERTIGEMVRGLRRLAEVFAEKEESGRVEFL
jgi:hypothetical protein